MNKKYVLNNFEDEEIFRLKFQNDVWAGDTLPAIEKAGFNVGDSILDLGCGPGYLADDLLNIVGPRGKIIAVDNSKKFIEYINKKNANENIHNIQTINCNAEDLQLERSSINGAVARWVFMFLENPENVIKNISGFLKHGGRFVVMEYFQFRGMSMWPPSDYFTKVYSAVYKLLKSYGGNADIGGYIPQLLAKNGFKILDIIPVFKVGKPNTPFWKWLEQTGRNHKNLVENKLITQKELDEYYQDWSERSKNPTSFFTTPPLLITIGIKK